MSWTPASTETLDERNENRDCRQLTHTMLGTMNLRHKHTMAFFAATLSLAGCEASLGSGVPDETETGDGDGDGDTGCVDGNLDCPCYGNQTCDEGLECSNEGICEPHIVTFAVVAAIEPPWIANR